VVSALGGAVEGERVALVNNQSDEALAPGESDSLGERVPDQSAHFTDVADAANSRAQLEEESILVEHSSECVGCGLGGCGLASTNIAVEDDEWIAVAESGDEPYTAIVMKLGPPSQAVDIGEKTHLPAQAVKTSREADEALSLLAQRLGGQFPPRLERSIWESGHAE